MKTVSLLMVGFLVFSVSCKVGHNPPPPPPRQDLDCSAAPVPNYSGLQISNVGSAKIYIVDIDQAPPSSSHHDEICLSLTNQDRVFWTDSDGRPLKFPKTHSNDATCDQIDPFKEAAPHPTNFGHMQHSNALNPAAKNCHYKLKFERHPGPDTDPHIAVGN